MKHKWKVCLSFVSDYLPEKETYCENCGIELDDQNEDSECVDSKSGASDE